MTAFLFFLVIIPSNTQKAERSHLKNKIIKDPIDDYDKHYEYHYVDFDIVGNWLKKNITLYKESDEIIIREIEYF